MLGIRVDANEKIAMGHLMRCLSIAKQLKTCGEKVIFFISEEYSKSFIEESGFECICLWNAYNKKDSETDMLLEMIDRYDVAGLLLDSYEVTREYMERLKKRCRLFYIDDINMFRYPVDMIINYTFQTDRAEYDGKGYGGETFLLGQTYVPLREEFGQDPITVREWAESIFLTTGGTDEYDAVTAILKKMQSDPQLSGMKKNVVVGKFYHNMKELQRLAEAYGRIKIYHDIPDIWRVMKMSDIAVSAGGTTLAELCACGLPTVCFAIAENQLSGTRAYAAAGLMIFAGNMMVERDAVVDNVISDVKMLSGDYQKRKKLSVETRRVIDGRGALRIAQEMIRMM